MFIIPSAYRLIVIREKMKFGGVYQRSFRGGSRFVWDETTLGIIIGRYFQFGRSSLKPTIHQIAPHVRALICEYVRGVVCCGGCSEGHFDRMRARWIRFPSLNAVIVKLRECSQAVRAVRFGFGETSYESLLADGTISHVFYGAMNREIIRG